ncbi:cysteine-rich DPF motif domain-containing protein 1 [Aplysia californica]|uniref:Cysteine-rich DPF motif domain-containing protein 1 n=1 Tax=Aplysia californica TaxID=6500 RepID=A0ABM0JF41_APLCA|nr:cysteine-rich DPF motif domain-containing protein 1 [Aplysia californica]
MATSSRKKDPSTKPALPFSCSYCDFAVDYHYKGRKPPFAKNILMLEDCYVMKDPFSTSGGFISVGGMCSLCARNVCMANTCSLFYTQRFCLNCVADRLEEFPQEIQQEVSQRLKERG